MTTGHDYAGAVRWVLMWVTALLAAVPAARGQDDKSDSRYLLDDAVLSAKQMYSFRVGDERVNVLLGDFSLRLGRRVLSGRDAVMWLTERRVGPRLLRDIEVYVETDARIVEPDGTVVRDQRIFDVIRHQGDLRARVGMHTGRELASFPLYQRALKVRTGAGKVERVVTTLPVLVRPDAKPPRPTTTAPSLGPLRRQPAFGADKIVSEMVPDPDRPGPKHRVTIARGNVYVTQGEPDDLRFLEMRSNAAVAYSVPDETVTGPIPERIVGVYLEGDVRLRRGERTLRAERLFYDFSAGRALAVRPVLRTIQEQRNIPVYIRAKHGRQLAAYEGRDELRTRGYEWEFTDALVTTSDFKVPEWSIAARRAYLKDTSIYAPDGTRLSERRWRTKLTHATVKLGHIPVLWTPAVVGDAEEGHTALKKLQGGRHGRFGWGIESEWFLFRLLGVPRPEGFKGRLEADWYERGILVGPTVKYERETFSGLARGSFLDDGEQEDDFGTDRRNVPARRERGWVLWRHKQFLPRDWEVQLELSYMCDRNFLEEFFPHEFWSTKEQETLVYGKKQRDNWAVTFLTKFHINEFVLDNARIGGVIAETESLPEVAGHVIGKSFLGDRLAYYGEVRLGTVRFRPKQTQMIRSSQSVGR
ncbi:MAG: LPS-assembly protein LptD, partial [Planctomycetota bacterium]